MTTRAARRAHQLEQKTDQKPIKETRRGPATRISRIRILAFATTAIVILGVGVYLAGGVFLGQRDKTTVANAVPVRLSMAGFDPKVITAKAGQTVTIDFWNTDDAMHLDGGGMHSFIMDDQKIYVKIPAEARKTYAFAAPATPGDYDFYCDTCCGGKQSPTMHGTLKVEA